MIVYWSSDLDFGKNCLVDLQNKRTSNSNPANFLSCPSVRSSWQNVWMFGADNDLILEYDFDGVKELNGNPVIMSREPHLEETNIFDLLKVSYFFSDQPLRIKVTAPYFHDVKYQKYGTFIGGVFDIGRWYRPVNAEIITWKESGTVKFRGGDPMFYAEFLTEEKVTLVRHRHTDLLEYLSNALVNSPFQTPKNFQGTLDSRYEAFDRSDYRAAILEEIQANLLPAEG
jgi:hypothetical protein